MRFQSRGNVLRHRLPMRVSGKANERAPLGPLPGTVPSGSPAPFSQGCDAGGLRPARRQSGRARARVHRLHGLPLRQRDRTGAPGEGEPRDPWGPRESDSPAVQRTRISELSPVATQPTVPTPAAWPAPERIAGEAPWSTPKLTFPSRGDPGRTAAVTRERLRKVQERR